MSEQVARLDDVFFLFNDVAGGADIDDIYEAFGHLNLNRKHDRTQLIESSIVPKFQTASEEQKKWIKFSISYFITQNPKIVKEKSHDYLFPFDFPDDTKELLIDIWDALFAGEKYLPTDHTTTVIT
jgi:hypothetical protein